MRHGRYWLAAAASAWLVFLAVASWRQTQYWHDGVLLFTRALACTQSNYITENNLATALERQGRTEESFRHFQRPIEDNPNFSTVQANYGDALRRRGQLDEAIDHLRRAVELDPDQVEAANNLGETLGRLGRLDEASACLEQALQRQPGFVPLLLTLAFVRDRQGKLSEAIALYQRAIASDPSSADAYANYDKALYKAGKPNEATAAFRESLRLRPDDLDTLRNAAWIAATHASADSAAREEAIRWAKRGVALSRNDDPLMIGILAAAYANAGQFALATATANQALELALDQGRNDVVSMMHDHLAAYRAGRPIRE